MRKLLLAAAAAVVLATPAMAFSEANNQVMLQDIEALICHPALDHSDRDPVVRTYVNLELDGTRDWTAKSFTVTHESFSGRMISRDDQYTGRLLKTPGKAEWFWIGTLNRNPSIQMKASVWNNPRTGWGYQETVYKNGYVDHVIPAEDCSENEGHE
jgi:hypothetical protein